MLCVQAYSKKPSHFGFHSEEERRYKVKKVVVRPALSAALTLRLMPLPIQPVSF